MSEFTEFENEGFKIASDLQAQWHMERRAKIIADRDKLIPELTSVIDEETGAIDGGTDALQKNLDEWRAYEEKKLAWAAYYAKERAVVEKKSSLYLLEFDAGAARQAAKRARDALANVWGAEFDENGNVMPVINNFGADFVRMGGGTRKVTVSFALLLENPDDRESAMQDIRNWAKIGAEYNLELPQFANRHLECAVTQLPDHSYRKWWENKLKLVFTCFNNPYWTSNEQIEVQCGTVFSIGGSAPPLMTIERFGFVPLTQQTYASKTESMTFSTIPAGSMVIDLNNQNAIRRGKK